MMCEEIKIPGNPYESYSDTVHETYDTSPFLSVRMRARKAIDHLQHGKCGPANITHKELDEWIKLAEKLEERIKDDE